MGKWKIPERMAIASVWVVWAFMAIGVLGWAIQVVIAWVGLEDAPGWVQALGSIGAIFITWFIGQQQLERERHRTEDERRRVRLDRKLADAQARRAEAARVFYLVNEFDFLNKRIDAARKAHEDLSAQRWLYVLQDLLSRFDYERSDGSKMTLVFELRQELLKLIDIFQVERSMTWPLVFYAVFESVSHRVRGIEVNANIDFQNADHELERLANRDTQGCEERDMAADVIT